MSIDQQINRSFRPVSEGLASVIFYAEPFTGYDIKLILVWLVIGALFLPCISASSISVISAMPSGSCPENITVKRRGGRPDQSFSGPDDLFVRHGGAGQYRRRGGCHFRRRTGAAFWMFVMGLFGMSTKFAEAAMG